MSRRRGGTIPVACTHEGCTARSFYEYRTNAEAIELRTKVAKWRCAKHHVDGRLLCESQLTKECVLVATREASDLTPGTFLPGLFWRAKGQLTSGFTYGPGFSADANDWPEGTELRITATITKPASAARRAEGQ